MNAIITPEMPEEELVRRFPEAVGFLTRRGVRCGEPLWCTLEELLKEDGVSQPDVLLGELDEFLDKAKKT